MASPQQTELAYAWEKYMDCRLQGADLQVGAAGRRRCDRVLLWVLVMLTLHFQDDQAVGILFGKSFSTFLFFWMETKYLFSPCLKLQNWTAYSISKV